MTTIKIPLFSEASHNALPSAVGQRKKTSKMTSKMAEAPAALKIDDDNDFGSAIQTRRKSSRKSESLLQPQQQEADFQIESQAAKRGDAMTEISILHTPRRGRRVGKVDLGWDSPIQPDSQLTVTPAKRRADVDSVNSVKLLDMQGRALAAMPRSYDETITSDFLHNSPNVSVDQSYTLGQFLSNTSPSRNDRLVKRLSGFEREETAALLPALVPIEVPLMGRMAIHRSEVNQIACIDTSSLTQSNSEKDSIMSSNSGNQSQSSDQTSLRTPEEIDSMSGFPLPSDFLNPESKLETQNIASFLGSTQDGLTVQDKIQTLRKISEKVRIPLDEIENSPISWKPKLMGNGMPQLNWPDSPSGPWSGAGKELQRLQEQKRRGIARWLEEESGDDENDEAISLAQRQQHPMVAKALHDKARKETLIRSYSMPTLRQGKHMITPSKRGRRPKVKEDDISPIKRKRGRKAKRIIEARGPHPLSSTTSPSSTIGCPCGSVDDSTPMVLCDACNLWYHLNCVDTPASDLGEEWFCSGCCDMAASVLSPSSLGDRASLIATPNFPRSAAVAGQQLRPSQGQLPVFTHPTSSHSPSVRPHHLQQQQLLQQHQAQLQYTTQYNFPTELALAPSPVFPTSERRSSTAGRHRASRIGWHQMEPGSPLERKSSHRRNVSNGVNSTTLFTSANQMHGSASKRRIPTYEQQDAFYPMPLRTPSPQPMSTPSRMRSSNNLSGHYRRESSNFDDIFSTPSRILQGSASWGANPTTSMVRHSREESGNAASASSIAAPGAMNTPWGLSTPIRSLMENDDLNSDRSEGHGGLPSLVFSSGGMADLVDFNWHLQSPSSSTRAAARARQTSNNLRYKTSTSSMRERTPTRQNSSSNLYSEANPSSSPFPKTPTFQDLMQHHQYNQQQQSQYHSSSQQYPQHSIQYSPSSASSKAFNRFTIGNYPLMTTSYDSQQSRHSNSTTTSLQSTASALEYHQGAAQGHHRRVSNIKSRQASNQQHQSRGRNASSGELMAGLGIGLDLDDVLDWA